MKLITEKEYRDFVNKRNEINELILTKTAQLSYILYNRCPDGECYNYDFEEEDGKIIVQFESCKCQETDYDTFYLPLEFLFDESYPEKYKLIYEDEKKKKEEERIRKENEEKEKKRLKTEKFEREEYERLKMKFENGICSICGKNGLIKYKTKYGRLICCYCAERPSDAIMEKLRDHV